MGDDIVEMTVWGQGAEESGKTGCTGCMRHVVGIASGLMLAIYLHFASGIKSFYFTKTLCHRTTTENVSSDNELLENKANKQ